MVRAVVAKPMPAQVAVTLVMGLTKLPAACDNTALRVMELLATVGFGLALWEEMMGLTVRAMAAVPTKGGLPVSEAVTTNESLPTVAVERTGSVTLQVLTPLGAVLPPV